MTKVLVLEDMTINGTKYGRNQIYDLQNQELQAVLDTSQALKFNVPEIDQYEKQVEQAVKTFKNQVQKIEQSTDPRYKDEDFKAEAVEELKNELKSTVDQVQAEYSDFLANLRDQAASEVANEDVRISNSQREQAQLKVKELSNAIKLRQGESALDQLAQDVQYMSESRQKALALELPALMDEVEGDSQLEKKVKNVYESAKPGESEASLFLRGVNALPNSITQAYDQLTIINRHFKGDNALNIHNENQTERRFGDFLPR
ncbi:hypothetical protein [Alkalibacillus almallahensis]|uniref:hypothetical protein n=1 Tax=Alkalibacillus almallahensis TaxID=1379154 RepID=UPI001420BBD5|nr:hypothetical protein [Alkalibacillus almallahensis]NIK13135.1 uncharacterized protein YukE [Alkalibacillus almallahensis]